MTSASDDFSEGTLVEVDHDGVEEVSISMIEPAEEVAEMEDLAR